MQGRRAGALVGGMAALMLGTAPVAPANANAQAPGNWCTAGAKLDVLSRGVWFPATVKSNGAGGCLVGFDGYNATWDERVGPDRAGPRGARRAFSAGGSAGAPAKPAAKATTRAAVAMPVRRAPAATASAESGAGGAGTAVAAGGAGGADGARLGSYHCVFYISGQGLQTVPGFTLQAGDRYRHETGGTGRTGFDAGTGVLEFTGGPLDGQAGKVDGKGVHLLNESRSRTVIDCNTR